MRLDCYAEAHGGRFPEHPQGFGDAMKLAMTDDADAWLFSGPGDDGSHLLVDGDVDEAQCSRVYVQGLTRSSDQRLALLFDRFAARGGDHRRSLWGPKLREVVLVGGTTEVAEEDWPAFVQKQVSLLIETGMTRETAEGIYRVE